MPSALTGPRTCYAALTRDPAVLSFTRSIPRAVPPYTLSLARAALIGALSCTRAALPRDLSLTLAVVPRAIGPEAHSIHPPAVGDALCGNSWLLDRGAACCRPGVSHGQFHGLPRPLGRLARLLVVRRLTHVCYSLQPHTQWQC